jgi:hypothetical protein
VALGARHRHLRRALPGPLPLRRGLTLHPQTHPQNPGTKKLVTVTWNAKRASLFQVWERKLAPTGRIDLGFAQARLYDLFSDEDRSLFLAAKRSLSPAVLKELAEEAGDPYTLDLLIFRRTFGPDRQRKYIHLTGSK